MPSDNGHKMQFDRRSTISNISDIAFQCCSLNQLLFHSTPFKKKIHVTFPHSHRQYLCLSTNENDNLQNNEQKNCKENPAIKCILENTECFPNTFLAFQLKQILKTISFKFFPWRTTVYTFPVLLQCPIF